MALRWDFNEDRMGHIEYEGMDEVITIYNGNAFAIFLAEDDKEYSLMCFYADEKHAKTCLGLDKSTKGKKPVFNDEVYTNDGEHAIPHRMTKVVLYPEARNARKLAELLLKAYDDITIELRRKPEKPEKDEVVIDLTR